MQTTPRSNKVKRINIYLNSQDRKILNEIRDKYHISYSTIANIIVDKIIYGQNSVKLSSHYYYEDDNSTKTSIKPRHASKESYFGDGQWPITKIFTNAIKVFTRNGWTEVLEMKEENVSKLKSRIYNEFQNTYDPNWDGNIFTRRAIKVFKENKDYIKRISKTEDI